MRRVAEKVRSAIEDATGSVKAVNRKPSADIARCLFVGRRTTWLSLPEEDKLLGLSQFFDQFRIRTPATFPADDQTDGRCYGNVYFKLLYWPATSVLSLSFAYERKYRYYKLSSRTLCRWQKTENPSKIWGPATNWGGAWAHWPQRRTATGQDPRTITALRWNPWWVGCWMLTPKNSTPYDRLLRLIW